MMFRYQTFLATVKDVFKSKLFLIKCKKRKETDLTSFSL